jgi:hypothetical protein
MFSLGGKGKFSMSESLNELETASGLNKLSVGFDTH